MGQAEVILRDALLDERYAELFPANAEVIFVGKRSGHHAMSQGDIQKILCEKAREGKRVVRLKGGDPYVYGRGGEEVMALREAGIPYEVIPGVSAVNGAATLADIPLTHRHLAREVLILEGRSLLENPDFDFEKTAHPETTVVIFMGSLSLQSLARKFLENGVDASRPMALVENASMPGETISVSTLDGAASGKLEKKTEGPGIIYLGGVAGLFHQDKIAPHAVTPTAVTDGSKEESATPQASLFPIFLSLKDQPVLVIGGGKVAVEKIRNLRGTGAVCHVVAETVAAEVKALVAEGLVSSIQDRRAVEKDLDGRKMIIAATNDNAVNRELAGWAKKRGILFNAVDDPEHCDFFTGAVIDQGPVRIALSTEGGFPGLSSYLRKILQILLPASHAGLWQKLTHLRKKLKGILPGSENRMNAMRSVMADLEKKYFNLNEAKAREIADHRPPGAKPVPEKIPAPPKSLFRKLFRKKEVHGV